MTNTTKQILTTIAYLLAFLLVLLVIRIVLIEIKTPDEVRHYRRCNDRKARAIQGVVIRRTGFCITLDDGSRRGKSGGCFGSGCRRQQFLLINIGDSIYKPANTFTYLGKPIRIR